jgi:hypothetical protein
MGRAIGARAKRESSLLLLLAFGSFSCVDRNAGTGRREEVAQSCKGPPSRRDAGAPCVLDASALAPAREDAGLHTTQGAAASEPHEASAPKVGVIDGAATEAGAITAED